MILFILMILRSIRNTGKMKNRVLNATMKSSTGSTEKMDQSAGLVIIADRFTIHSAFLKGHEEAIRISRPEKKWRNCLKPAIRNTRCFPKTSMMGYLFVRMPGSNILTALFTLFLVILKKN